MWSVILCYRTVAVINNEVRRNGILARLCPVEVCPEASLPLVIAPATEYSAFWHNLGWERQTIYIGWSSV